MRVKRKPIVILVIAMAGILATKSMAQEKPRDLVVFRPPPNEARSVVDGFLWVEAEDFTDYGEWKLDTQFVHKMGSAYLLACGSGMSIGEATTHVDVPGAGTYRVWARTKNWLPEFSPGRFTIAVDGKRSAQTLGAVPKAGWLWESAGDFEVKAGQVRLALVDLSGAFARCDALLMTRDLAYVPPNDQEACQRERARLTGLPQEVTDGGEFDVVVVGAGTSGIAAAVAAARMGAITALAHDRPVLGGNASDELGVWTCGASVSHPNARESGLIEEANLWRGKTSSGGYSGAFAKQVANETNLTIFNNLRVNNVEMRNKRSVKKSVCVQN